MNATWLPCAGIPDWIGWLRYLSFIYYGFGMLLHYEYHGRTIYSCVDPSQTTEAHMTVQARTPCLPLMPLAACAHCCRAACMHHPPSCRAYSQS